MAGQDKRAGPQLHISICAFAAVAAWCYLSSSYGLIQNCALVHAAGWVPMAESSCAWTKAGWHKAKIQQSGLPTGLGYTPLLHAHRRANTLWCLSSDERRNNLGVLAGRAHVDTFEWLTVLGPRLLRWLVG